MEIDASAKKKGLYKKGGIWWYAFADADGKRIQQSTGFKNYNAALKFYEKEIEPYKRAIKEGKLLSKIRLLKYSDRLEVSKKWRGHIEKVKNSKSSWLWKMYYMLQHRIKMSPTKNIKLELVYDDFVRLAILSNGRCQLTDIPFSSYKPKGARVAPYKPSLDRIDSSGNYSRENCRLVCFCVNMALNEWGEEVLEKLSMAFLYRKLRTEFEEKLIFENPGAFSSDYGNIT